MSTDKRKSGKEEKNPRVCVLLLPKQISVDVKFPGKKLLLA